MLKEKIAFDRGYRVSKEGVLYNLNGRNYKTQKTKASGFRFFVNIGNKKNITVYLGRLQAYQKFGNQFFEYKGITYLDGSSFNPSFDNISLGKGFERFRFLDIPFNLSKEETALRLGFSVNNDGQILYNGFLKRPAISGLGYQIISFQRVLGRSTLLFVHRLQAYQKFGKKLFNFPLVRHLNGDKLDNSFNNILLGDHAQNYKDIPKNEQITRYKKAAISRSGFSPQERKSFRDSFDGSLDTVSSYARKLNVPQSTMYSIINSKSKYLDNVRIG
tara:strand:+ start:6935 stop:7756 length:822 start_codon:yes stop_codon:yes gene_type:complete